MAKATVRWKRRPNPERKILSPELTIYSLFASTLNVLEIGEPEVAIGSSSQFFAIHRHFTVFVVVRRRRHELKSSRASC